MPKKARSNDFSTNFGGGSVPTDSEKGFGKKPTSTDFTGLAGGDCISSDQGYGTGHVPNTGSKDDY